MKGLIKRIKGEFKVHASSKLSPLGLPLQLNVHKGGELIIGEETVLFGGMVTATSKIVIGNRVSIGPECIIVDSSFHSIEDNRSRILGKPILIEDDVFIGVRVMIMPGVKIGKGAKIGSGSVVTKDVSPYHSVMGVPAKEISNTLDQVA